MSDFGILIAIGIFWFVFFGPLNKAKEEKKDDKKGKK